MGVDFRKSGMSYPRYDDLVTSVAKYYGGEPNIDIPKDREEVFYPFGFLEDNPKSSQVKEKFTFDDLTPAEIKKWCNHPYSEDFTHEELQVLANILVLQKEGIADDHTDADTIEQFIRELLWCIVEDEPWEVS
jgi:hypothetical protein